MEPLFEDLRSRAVACPQRIVLPESTEPRTLRAADRILADGVAQVILIGARDNILQAAADLNLTHIDQAAIIDPADIKHGDADGQVAGAQNATGNVLRAAFQVLKTAPGVSTVSGAFIMMLPEGSPYGERGIMVMADCAVVPDPDAKQLAEIAVLAEATARNIAGIDPKVAMLSFSTKGSASHERVDKVVEATRLAREMNPAMHIDGELQADAALVPSVAASKAPGSDIAGHANVLVFPDLGTGNIAYKLVQRLAGATAVGPILQGLAAPVSDLSRGCSDEDIYKTIIITCNQAIAKK